MSIFPKQDSLTLQDNAANGQRDSESSQSWIWPKGTYFQRRLNSVRQQQSEDSSEVAVRENVKVNGDAAKIAAAQSTHSARSHEDEKADVGEDLVTASSMAERTTVQNSMADTNQSSAEIEPRPVSQAQVPPAPESAEWIRTGVETKVPVDINAGGLDRAPRKGNLDRFRYALVDSGEWTRGEVETSVPAAKSVNTEPRAADARPNIAVNEPKIAVSKPPQSMPVVVAAQPPKIVVPTAAGQQAEPRVVSTSLIADENPWRLIDQEFKDSSLQAAPCEEIEEKYRWLAKPSS